MIWNVLSSISIYYHFSQAVNYNNECLINNHQTEATNLDRNRAQLVNGNPFSHLLLHLLAILLQGIPSLHLSLKSLSNCLSNLSKPLLMRTLVVKVWRRKGKGRVFGCIAGSDLLHIQPTSNMITR